MPRGIYKHPPQCGFQKGHPDFRTKEGILEMSRKISEKYKTGELTHYYKGKKILHLENYQFKKNSVPWNKGKNVLQTSEENNYGWKGDDVGYVSLHIWAKKHLGQPKICEYCGKEKESNRKIHWANKSGKYKRDKDDWLRLCVSCHRKYDNKRRKKCVC